MSTNFQGKTIVLTGGASGIGLATSKLLYARGANLHIADLNPSALDSAISAIRDSASSTSTSPTSTSAHSGASVTGTTVNVRDRKAVEAWIQHVVERHGKLDGAANLAGVIGRQIGVANIEDVDDDDWDFVMGVNLGGVLNCLRAQIPAMKEAQGETPGGSIVNAASIAGIIGREKNSAYCASKHAVVGLTRSAAKEQGPRGVRVNCIAPGPIETPMISSTREAIDETVKRDVPMGRVGRVPEVAELICWLLCDGSSYISGTVQSIDGGWAC